MVVEEPKPTADITLETEESFSNDAFKDPSAVQVTGESAYSTSSAGENTGPKKPQDSAFAGTEDPRYYRPIDAYEGLHRWDPYFDWTEQEEKRIVRKVSYHYS